MILSLRNRLKVLIYVGAGLVLLMSIFDGGPTLGLTQQRLAFAEAGLFILLTTFDRFLWRWGKVPELLRTGPLLRGTWQGTVSPSDDPERKIRAYLSIRQSFSSVAFRLLTEESASESTTARLTQEEEGLTRGEYFYQNVPRDSVRDRSAIHFGSVRFECVGPRPERIQGEYFTSRKTTGELEFPEHKQEIVHSFEDAERLFATH